MTRLMFCACICVLFATRTRGEEFQVALRNMTCDEKDTKDPVRVPANAEVQAAVEVEVESGKRTRVKAQIGDSTFEMRVSVRRSAGEEVEVNLVATHTRGTHVQKVVRAGTVLRIGTSYQLGTIPDLTGKKNEGFSIRVTKLERGH